MREKYGLGIMVHPHADTHIDTEEHVERFLDATDSDLVNLCLDTGHYAYCGGDSVKLIETYGERIGYLHLKQVDPGVLADVVAKGTPFGPAVRQGVMCEPPLGVPALEPVLTAAQGLGVDLFAIVEQDMYPCPPDKPLPIARAHPAIPARLRSLTGCTADGCTAARLHGSDARRRRERRRPVTSVTIVRSPRHRPSTGPPSLSLSVVHQTQVDDQQPLMWPLWEVPSCPIDDSGRTRTSPRTSESRRTRCARTASTACCHHLIW